MNTNNMKQFFSLHKSCNVRSKASYSSKGRSRANTRKREGEKNILDLMKKSFSCTFLFCSYQDDDHLHDFIFLLLSFNFFYSLVLLKKNY